MTRSNNTPKKYKDSNPYSTGAHSHNLGETKLLYNLLPGVILKGISIQPWITTGGDYVYRDITAIRRRSQGKRS